MIKVAQILYSGLGGHGSVAFSLLDADKKPEWESVMGFLGVEPLSFSYEKVCKERDISYKYFKAKRGKPWRSWPAIFRWLIACVPDAIILHTPSAILPCFWYAFRYRVPLVVVEHEPNSLKRPPDWMFSKIAMFLANSIVVLTSDYNQEMKKYLGTFYNENKANIIPNGIDTKMFVVSDCSIVRDGVVRLGMAARFTVTKRQDVLVKMLVDLQRLLPDIFWQLSLAGNGENWKNILHLVQEENLQAQIELPGQLGQIELIRWYQSLDVYLHASEGETLSTSLLQAMSCGLPIVASDVPGIANLIGGENQCGLLVKVNEPYAYAEAVARLVKNASLKAMFGDRGRSLVIASYSHDKMFTGYRDLIRKYV